MGYQKMKLKIKKKDNFARQGVTHYTRVHIGQMRVLKGGRLTIHLRDGSWPGPGAGTEYPRLGSRVFLGEGAEAEVEGIRSRAVQLASK